jgi:hypothetical protein
LVEQIAIPHLLDRGDTKDLTDLPKLFPISILNSGESLRADLTHPWVAQARFFGEFPLLQPLGSEHFSEVVTEYFGVHSRIVSESVSQNKRVGESVAEKSRFLKLV